MKIIVVVDENWGIGKDNDLLFRLPKDMQHFKNTTLNSVVVMGKNTLFSLPNAQPLKNRTNIVLWEGGSCEGAIVVNNLRELFAELDKHEGENIFVIGGASVYRTLLPYCESAIITKVNADGRATHFFENLDELKNWKLTFQSPYEQDGEYQISFCEYKNLEPKKFETDNVLTN